jgi:hypothetical protein
MMNRKFETGIDCSQVFPLSSLPLLIPDRHVETIETYIQNTPVPTNTAASSAAIAKLSNNARLQRFVVSKMAGSSVGQDVLSKAVGQDFQDMIECLTSAIAKCLFVPSCLLLTTLPSIPLRCWRRCGFRHQGTHPKACLQDRCSLERWRDL